MNELNESITTERTMREIHKAQQALDAAENKMKSFKKERAVYEHKHIQAPVPDLSKYFTFLSN
jgi:hypothetical protein